MPSTLSGGSSMRKLLALGGVLVGGLGKKVYRSNVPQYDRLQAVKIIVLGCAFGSLS